MSKKPNKKAQEHQPLHQFAERAYLNYAMYVILDRALPHVADGLKPVQRRIIYAMSELGLKATAKFKKSARTVGDVLGKYHPHGDSACYEAMVLMAQSFSYRYPLVDGKGNFGSIDGDAPAAYRYTEGKLTPITSYILNDLKKNTVEFRANYDNTLKEPVVLPTRVPNLLINGSSGIAVGMATSIPPHNLGEICQGILALIDNPQITVRELMEYIPGPDFPTGGIICGKTALWRSYETGRSTIVVRAKTTVETKPNGRSRIVVSNIPYQQTRDSVIEKLSILGGDGRVAGISDVADHSNLEEPVRIVIDLKKDVDPDVVLNQLWKYSPLQDSFSVILLALVDNKPRTLSLKEMLEEFIRHRVIVIRRRTQFLLIKARKRKHTVEGLLLAHTNIDEVIRVIRASKSQPEAKQRLMDEIRCPAAMLQRALGDTGFVQFQQERGVAEEYFLTPVQADAILKMTLGQLVNLEQEKLTEEHAELLGKITTFGEILDDESRVYDIIRDDCEELVRKLGSKRRTELSDEEVGNVDIEDLIEEETMVVSISHNGYIKRTAASTYRAQRRGGKGVKGAKTDQDDPVEHLFVTSTHDYLLFFTNHGKVYWQKVYNLPQLSRDAKGRAIVNLLNLAEGEKIADCRAIRDFDEPGHYLLMATRKGLVKKTELKAYRRPLKSGMIAIKLKDGDELVDVVVAAAGQEVVLATAGGLAIRFKESDARPMGRNTSGVKGITLAGDDQLVGMVIADSEATLLTACANGYGKRTPFGVNNGGANGDDQESGDEGPSGFRYRTQNRGGKGVRDIKTTNRNGPVIGIAGVHDEDELIMMTSRGKIQRIKASDIGAIGRNTQGVRIMSVDRGDTLTAVVRVPREENDYS